MKTRFPYYVGMRADHKPYVPSIKKPCSECNHDIWVDKKLIKISKQANALICEECLLKKLDEEKKDG